MFTQQFDSVVRSWYDRAKRRIGLGAHGCRALLSGPSSVGQLDSDVAD